MRASSSVAIAVVLVLLVLGLAGCGQQEQTSGKETGTAQASQTSGSAARSNSTEGSKTLAVRPYKPLGRVVVTSDAQKLPAGCKPRQMAGLMTHFVAAFNRGDQEQLRRFFPARAGLEPWLYSMDRFLTYNREDLLRYFARRHRHHERMRLLSIQVIPNGFISDGKKVPSGSQARTATGSRPLGGITFLLARRADDLKKGPEGPERPTVGKGVVDCRRQKILRASIGTLPAKPKNTFDSVRVCRKLDGPNQGGTIVACTGSSR